jgi:hypothetical protein
MNGGHEEERFDSSVTHGPANVQVAESCVIVGMAENDPHARQLKGDTLRQVDGQAGFRLLGSGSPKFCSTSCHGHLGVAPRNTLQHLKKSWGSGDPHESSNESDSMICIITICTI